jgi:ribonuclease VapC
MPTKVIDSWAMLAWLQDEPSAATVDAFLQDAEAGKLQLVMSWINAGETFYILARRKGLPVAEEFLIRLPSLPIRLVLPDRDAVIAAARLKSARQLAYADAFAASLALHEHATVITGDPEIAVLRDLVTVDWIGLPAAPNNA